MSLPQAGRMPFEKFALHSFQIRCRDDQTASVLDQSKMSCHGRLEVVKVFNKAGRIDHVKASLSKRRAEEVVANDIALNPLQLQIGAQ